jgi:hypothetical protein
MGWREFRWLIVLGISAAIQHAVGNIHPLGEGRSKEAEGRDLIC